MTEQTPLDPVGPKDRVRAQMWLEAKARHETESFQALEVRAGDHIGPNATSFLGDRVVPKILAGKGCTVEHYRRQSQAGMAA